MRLFQSFNSEYLQVKFNVLMLLVCLFCESVSQPLYKNEPKIEIYHHQFIVPDKYVMRNMGSLNGYSAPHTLGLNRGLKVIFGITELDFHQSSASLSFQITNVGTQVQFPANSGIFIERLFFRLVILNQTVLYKIAVDSMIIYDNAIPEIFILTDIINCQVMDKGIGYRSENYTFQINTKPDFQPQARQIYASLYYRGFNLFNPNGSYFYLNWEFYYNHTDYTIVFHTQDENLVSFIRFSIIVVDINDVYERKDYSRYFVVDMVNCSNTSIQTCPGKLQFTFPNYQPTFKSYLFGLTKLNFTKHQPTKWFIDTNDISTLNPGYIETNSLKWVNLTVFIIAELTCVNPAEFYDPQTKTCIANCLAAGGTYFLTGASPGGTNLCRKCHYSCSPGQCAATGDTQCNVCNPAKNRQPDPTAAAAPYKCQCLFGHIDVGTQYCPPCSLYLPGCVDCSSTTSCNACGPNMHLNVNNQCQCTLVQTTSRYGTCQGIVGCLVYFNDPVRSTVCIECNITQNFKLFNYTCECIAGYQLQSIGGRWVCVALAEVCGDGIRTISQPCDDFNNVNMDGCNGTCQVEIGFICFGNLRQTSFCIENISSLQYVGAMKIEGHQTADLYFQLWPYNQRLQDVGFLSKYLQTSISNFSSMRNLQIFTQKNYANDKLRIRLRYDYTQDVNPTIQHNMTLLVYDRQKQLPIQTKFKVVGANLKLTMVESQSNIIPLNYVMLVLVILAFIAMFVSLFTNNWIGIETLNTFQFCFFYYVLLGDIDQRQYKYLNFLQFCNGFNHITNDFSYYEYVDFNRKIYLLDMSKEILYNFNFTALLFCIPIILVIWNLLRKLPKLYSYAKKSRGTSEASQYRSRSPKLDYILSTEFIVGKLFITFNLIFMNIIIISFFIEQTHYFQQGQHFNRIFQQFYLFALVTSVMVTIGLLILAAVKPFKYDGVSIEQDEDSVDYVKFKRFSPTYPIIYTSVVGIKIILVALFVSDSYSPYILLAVEILYFIGFLLVRPYKRVRNYQIKYCYSLHNLHNIWNSIGLIVLISILIIANSNGNSSTFSMITVIKVIILVVQLISVIFAYMRLFVSKRLARIAKNIEKQKQIENSPLEGYPNQDTDRTLRRNTSSMRKGSIGQRSQSRIQQEKINNRPRQPTGNSYRSNSPSRNRYIP